MRREGIEMRLTKADKETLILAMHLAIRDKETGINPDVPDPEMDAELRKDIERFTALRDKIVKALDPSAQKFGGLPKNAGRKPRS